MVGATGERERKAEDMRGVRGGGGHSLGFVVFSRERKGKAGIPSTYSMGHVLCANYRALLSQPGIEAASPLWEFSHRPSRTGAC